MTTRSIILGKTLAAGAAVFLINLSALASSLPISLGDAGNYAVLGVGGTMQIESDFAVYQSATVINGNVGVGPDTAFTHGIDCTINGALNYDNTVTLPAITGTITGGTHQQSMSSTSAAAVNASTQYAGLTTTMTVSTLTDGGTLNLSAGLNVIKVTGDVTLKQTFTINGSANSSVVFLLTANDATSAHQLTLSGVQMILTGGITANGILWDMNGTGGDIQITSGADVDGIFLAPDRDITVDNGNILGEVIGGGDGTDLQVHSSSEITELPQSVPDAAATALLLGLGCGFMFLGKRKFLGF